MTVRYPAVLQVALDAQARAEMCDWRKHPRIAQRWDQAQSAARQRLATQYPEIEAWLFGYPYQHLAERRAELARLLEEVSNHELRD